MSVNPYQLLPIYDMRVVKKYVNKRIGLLQPHIFAVADDAFRQMSENSTNQSVIIRFFIIFFSKYLLTFHIVVVRVEQESKDRFVLVLFFFFKIDLVWFSKKKD